MSKFVPAPKTERIRKSRPSMKGVDEKGKRERDKEKRKKQREEREEGWQ